MVGFTTLFEWRLVRTHGILNRRKNMKKEQVWEPRWVLKVRFGDDL